MRKTKVPSLVTVAFFTMLTVIGWTVFGVIRILTTKSVPVNISTDILAPINPTLDKNTVDKIQQTLYFDNNEK